MGVHWGWARRTGVTAAAAAAVVAATATVTLAARVGHPAARRGTGDASVSVARGASPLPVSPSGVETLPFPSPPAGVRPVGRFHELPSLQCRLHPATAGGPSPDPAAVAAPADRGGGAGWVLRANASAAGTVIPYAPGTCASPLEGIRGSPFLATYGGQDDSVLPALSSAAAPSGGRPGRGGGAAEFAWLGAAFHAKATRWAVARAPSGAAATSQWFHPQPCGAHPGRHGLVCEEEVSRLLTLQRNQWFGEVRRQQGVYDVAAVTRTTFGVALDGKAAVVAALDTVSAAAGPRECDRVAVVTYTTADGHRRPVLVGEAALLSLGRGVLADSSWLGAAFPGGLAAKVSFTQAPRTVRATWSLGHTDRSAINSSLWLQGVASTVCWPPAASFVRNGSLCDGVQDAPPSGGATARAGVLYRANYVGDSGGHFVGGAEVGARWVIETPRCPPLAPSCPPAFDNLEGGVASRQPIWLLGRGSRELHTTMPGGEEELALANHLSSCTYNRTRPELLSRTPVTRILGDLTSELSQRYNRDYFGRDPPAEPVTNVELVLAVLVVMPEVAAVLLLLLQLCDTHTRPRALNWRQGLTFALVVLAGGAALVGIGYLDRVEQAGHAWRAASVRLETRLPINRTEEERMDRDTFDYRGRVLTYTETLLLVARTGYRPAQTRRLLVGSAATYVMLTAVVIVRAVVQAWLLSAPFSAAEEEDPDLPDEGDAASGKQWSPSSFVTPFAYIGKSTVLSAWRRTLPASTVDDYATDVRLSSA